MKLFLASIACDSQTIKVLEEYIGGFDGKTIAYIPTAANGEGWESWKSGRTFDFMNSSSAKVNIVELEKYHNNVINELKGKDIIWFGGGMTGYLMYWIRRTGLDKHIHDILRKSIYVGSSAGSMITGASLDIAEWFPGDTELGSSIFPSLNLVDFDIFPHYDETKLEAINMNYKGKKLYLLKDGEEIIVEDDRIRVIGEERVIAK